MAEWFLRDLPNFKEGTIVKGRVIEKRPHEVVIDIGYKSEGSVPITEFEDPEAIQVGDEVEVLLEQLEDEHGMVVLSRQKAAQKQNWEKVVQAYREGLPVTGRVRQLVKGGLMVDIGVDAFLPASQVDVVAPRNLKDLEGTVITCKIVKLNEERKNVVLSRREIVEAERAEKRARFLASVQKGDLVRGVVKNITDFGAFIELDGIDGLLHITDMSWGRISHPSELLKIGQEVEVVVLEIDREKERVSLGLKQKAENPWERITEKYPPGTVVKGKVTTLLPYGAFVELEPGVEGLLHVSELSWTKRISKPSEVLSVGQEVEAKVLDANKEEQKISLSLRALEPNPWERIAERFPIGSVVNAKVRSFTAYGAYVDLAEEIEGFIHVNDLDWTRKINHPSEVLKKGEEVQAKVLDIDKANQRILLGIKQLSEDPWKTIESRYQVGDVVTGKVTKVASFGAFVQLDDGIDGLVHISQISNEKVTKVKDVLKVGQEVKARIIKIDKEERRIGLSIKALDYSPEQLEKERVELVRSGEELTSMEEAFSRLEEDYRPGQSKKKAT
ncbi:30S ribosomal protein S1 [Candidatus Methylacidithermus pantelleriae]|uniref:30S ribosomal protein S1 n=1 Tax=Candidatus Methylacidithermus pantelleriae TaxID=2744239 RepID=A0A8J2BRP3_9BACT|nr:30S ribosomal protein S1 [Candidatus Methylacidithermus pantelleriae]CAF0692554.1 30S ribosomal protein S1 [Candidatus Methylacidithermus pantelleriae]